MNENTIRAFKEIALDILDLFKSVLKSDVGINKKVGKNTLAKSRLAKLSAVNATTPPFIQLLINDYIDAIEEGRRPKAPLVSIEALRDWAQRKGIKSDNQTLTNIQYGIWRDGIKGRPVMKTFFRLLDKEWNDKYAEMLYNEIINEIEKIFDK